MASAVVTTGEGGGGWVGMPAGKDGTSTAAAVGEGSGPPVDCEDTRPALLPRMSPEDCKEPGRSMTNRVRSMTNRLLIM